MKRALLIIVAVVAFLAISVVVARWLNNDTAERGAVTALLRDQESGDATKMLARLKGCGDPACQALVRSDAKTLRSAGALKIALYESGTAHSATSRTRFSRVVWYTNPDDTKVQCVLVRRKGNLFAGMTVSLLRITAPIGREASCPPS